VDVSFAKADQVARMTPGGHVDVLGQLPATGNCPVIGIPASAGIARASDGAIYIIDCTGNADTGMWRIAEGCGSPEVRFAHRRAGLAWLCPLDLGSGPIFRDGSEPRCGGTACRCFRSSEAGDEGNRPQQVWCKYRGARECWRRVARVSPWG